MFSDGIRSADVRQLNTHQPLSKTVHCQTKNLSFKGLFKINAICADSLFPNKLYSGPLHSDTAWIREFISFKVLTADCSSAHSVPHLYRKPLPAEQNALEPLHIRSPCHASPAGYKAPQPCAMKVHSLEGRSSIKYLSH